MKVRYSLCSHGCCRSKLPRHFSGVTNTPSLPAKPLNSHPPDLVIEGISTSSAFSLSLLFRAPWAICRLPNHKMNPNTVSSIFQMFNGSKFPRGPRSCCVLIHD